MRWISRREHEAAIQRLQGQITSLQQELSDTRQAINAVALTLAQRKRKPKNEKPPARLVEGNVIIASFGRKSD